MKWEHKKMEEIENNLIKIKLNLKPEFLFQ